MSDSVHEWTLPVRAPYRLDLTATVLRRLSTNVVDIYEGGTYRRTLGDAAAPVALEVCQNSATALAVRTLGPRDGDVAPLVGAMLGVDVDLTPFYAAACGFPWLARIVRAARGVKPPRYPSLWEAIVNAVVFQQVSIHAAAAILRRVVERYAPATASGTLRPAPFPPPQTIVDADPQELRDVGLSVNKVVALRVLGRAVLDGQLEMRALDVLPTRELVDRLQAFKGIGPWTAAVIALRGFGRLDNFPLKDSGVARGFIDLSGEANVDSERILAALGEQRGMLYYHLLLGRLAARGDIVLDDANAAARDGFDGAEDS